MCGMAVNADEGEPLGGGARCKLNVTTSVC